MFSMWDAPSDRDYTGQYEPDELEYEHQRPVPRRGHEWTMEGVCIWCGCRMTQQQANQYVQESLADVRQQRRSSKNAAAAAVEPDVDAMATAGDGIPF